MQSVFITGFYTSSYTGTLILVILTALITASQEQEGLFPGTYSLLFFQRNDFALILLLSRQCNIRLVPRVLL